MAWLTQRLFDSSAVRGAERRAIEGVAAAADLMSRAATAALRVLRWQWPRARRIAVVCGSGNNGGDGYVLARLAKDAGLDVQLYAVGHPSISPAREAAQAAHAAGLATQALDAKTLARADVIVDALFGIGLKDAPRAGAAQAIAAINAAARPVLALDVPSGVDADTGRVHDTAVSAQLTVTFIALKPGLFTGKACGYVGDVWLEDLSLPSTLLEAVAPAALRMDRQIVAPLVPVRAAHAHKGDHGHAVLLAGNVGMAGAGILAAAAAYRAGAGLVTLATHRVHAAHIGATLPEPLVFAVDDGDLASLLVRAEVVGCGPGLGRDRWSETLCEAASCWPGALIFDADALNWLARQTTPPRRNDWILTPHPGEAARLLHCSIDEIQRDRVAAARTLAQNFGGVCVLKGAGTVVAAGNDVWICDRGNAGLATAGTGDILTGIIVGLRAQGLAAVDAALLGVWLHADAGDRCAIDGMRGLMAHDLLPEIRAALSRLATPA